MQRWCQQHTVIAAHNTLPSPRPPFQAYARCHKANPSNEAACNNLQTSLVMCYAAGEVDRRQE